MWLAECAYHPSFDAEIAAAGVRFTLVDTHGVTLARRVRLLACTRPSCRRRGWRSSRATRSRAARCGRREEGYPGDPYYRDFYRDIGFDLPESELMGEVAGDGSRLMTGIKYYRITGKTSPRSRTIRASRASGPGITPATSSTTAALQIQHLSAAHPGAHRGGALRCGALRPLVVRGAALPGVGVPPAAQHARRGGGHHLRGYLERNPVSIEATPAASSWGAGGYGEVWVGPEAAWSWRHVHHATRYVAWLVKNQRGIDGARGRALDQTIRELLLLQSSDWNFIIKTGTSLKYAESRIRVHVHRLRRLGHLVQTGVIEGEDAAWLEDVSARDNFFHQLESATLRSAFDSN